MDLLAYVSLCLPDPATPGHLPELALGGAEPGGVRGQPGAAGPGRQHAAARGLPARLGGLRHQHDPGHLPQQAAPGAGDAELER